MKRALYSLLFLLLMSCGTSSHLQGSRIEILFKDSVIKSYQLLSVRDSSLVVHSYDLAEFNPQIISFSKVNRIYHSVDGKKFGGIIGCAAFSLPIFYGSVPLFALLIPNLGYGAYILFLPSMVLGYIIGYSVANDNGTFDLQDKIDLYSIKAFAKYRNNEPPEIKDIK
jgi:hypothetical protein